MLPAEHREQAEPAALHYRNRVADSYFADTSRFPHETIDGETVLIDSAKGHLFLFAGTGPWLWQRLIAGGTIDEVVAESTVRYGDAAGDPTRQFLDNLIEAQMILPGTPPSAEAAEVHTSPWPAGFVAPVIERYDEISDIISMDPIHEVDPAKGWPHRPGDGA